MPSCPYVSKASSVCIPTSFTRSSESKVNRTSRLTSLFESGEGIWNARPNAYATFLMANANIA